MLDVIYLYDIVENMKILSYFYNSSPGTGMGINL